MKGGYELEVTAVHNERLGPEQATTFCDHVRATTRKVRNNQMAGNGLFLGDGNAMGSGVVANVLPGSLEFDIHRTFSICAFRQRANVAAESAAYIQCCHNGY